MDTDELERRREKAREWARKTMADPEKRAHKNAMQRARLAANPETYERRRAAVRERLADPEVRERDATRKREYYTAKNRERRADPEYRARAKAMKRARYASDPEYRARVKAAVRERLADPEYRRKRLEKSRQGYRDLQTTKEFLRELGHTETLSERDLRAARRIFNHVHAGGELPPTDEDRHA